MRKDSCPPRVLRLSRVWGVTARCGAWELGAAPRGVAPQPLRAEPWPGIRIFNIAATLSHHSDYRCHCSGCPGLPVYTAWRPVQERAERRRCCLQSHLMCLRPGPRRERAHALHPGGLTRKMSAKSGAAHPAVTGHSHHIGSRALGLLVPL